MSRPARPGSDLMIFFGRDIAKMIFFDRGIAEPGMADMRLSFMIKCGERPFSPKRLIQTCLADQAPGS